MSKIRPEFVTDFLCENSHFYFLKNAVTGNCTAFQQITGNHHSKNPNRLSPVCQGLHL
jgi:hypothetical protein